MTLTRDPQNGLLSGSTLGSVTDAWTYNAFAEPLSYPATAAGIPILTEQVTRNDAGQIVQKNETILGVTHSYGYSYDTAGRLTGVTVDGTPNSSYSYDANSNRLPGTYDDQDRMLSYGGATYTYTAPGELATKMAFGSTSSYSYDELGNLTHVALPNGEVIDYVIDGQNRRVGKKINGILVRQWLYGDALRIVAELDGTGNLISRFVYGSRANVPDYMVRGGMTYRILSDHLGSPRLIVNTGDGTIAERLDYDAFGVVIGDTNPTFQPFGFAGGLYDPDTGFVRFRARDYDASTGRWTAKDPVGFGGGQANQYSYALTNPVNFIDTSGLSSVVFSPSQNTITIVNGAGQSLGDYPAGNNTQHGTVGPWPIGTYEYSYWIPHAGERPNSTYGSNGNFVFDRPGCSGCGVHSGRINSPDLLGRTGIRHATFGCIRTTDDATGLLRRLTQSGDRLSGLLVTNTILPTNPVPIDSSLPGDPTAYLPDNWQ